MLYIHLRLYSTIVIPLRKASESMFCLCVCVCVCVCVCMCVT